MLGSFERHAFDAALRYAGVPLQAHARFGSLGPLRRRICSLVAARPPQQRWPLRPL
jgi:hypothetical protein